MHTVEVITPDSLEEALQAAGLPVTASLEALINHHRGEAAFMATGVHDNPSVEVLDTVDNALLIVGLPPSAGLNALINHHRGNAALAAAFRHVRRSFPSRP